MKRRGGGGRRLNPHQLVIEWNQVFSTTSPGTTVFKPDSTMDVPGELAASSAAALNEHPTPNDTRHPKLVQVLPWDFVTSFPPAAEDAIEAGILSEEDATPARIAAMHLDLSGQLLNILAEQDAFTDARRRGVDPKTNGKPRCHAGKERLKRSVEARLVQLDRNWQSLMGAHEAAFGHEASSAFDKAIRARHGGVVVTTDNRKAERPANSPSPEPDRPAEKRARLPYSVTSSRRVTVPVPKPLRHAVAAGHFGHDENGPVNPSADEVREITVYHSEELVDLLTDLKEAQLRGPNNPACNERAERVNAAVRKYAEDFGQRAADQLLAYARRQLLLQDSRQSVRTR